MKNISDFPSAVVISNSLGIIQEYNDYAELFFNQPLKNNSVSSIISKFPDLPVFKADLQSGIIYFFEDLGNSNPFFNMMQLIEMPLSLCFPDGKIIFSNKNFQLNFTNDNINLYFSKCCENWLGLNLIIQTKKQMSFRVCLNEKEWNVDFIPLFSNSKEVSHIFVKAKIISQINQLESELKILKKELKELKTEPLENNDTTNLNIKLTSPQMQEIYTLIENLAPRQVTILLLGKSGTGKSRFAKEIHNRSYGKSKPFVTINCSAIPDTLLESELFGYEKGAFTGALTSGKKGLVEAANNGTLFLDEIGEIPLFLQGKLLELIQEKTYKPIGAISTKKANIRIIAATNKNLLDSIQEGSFREDLYYRIAVAIINIPPLCEHIEDISLLINGYLHHFNQKHQKKIAINSESMKILTNYKWPGNIRELEHLVEFLVLSNNELITVSDLPINIVQEVNKAESYIKNSSVIDLDTLCQVDTSYSLDDIITTTEASVISQYYKKYKSSYKVAKALNISQSKANRLIQKYCK